MLRVASFVALVAGLLNLAAYQAGDPKFLERPFPVNSTIANFFLEGERPAPAAVPSAVSTDSAAGLRVLMLNYTAYDSAYVSKVKGLIAQRLPGVITTDFWDGSAQALHEVLHGQQIVVVTYPARGNPRQVRAYGKILDQFVQQGGAVVFSGTDQFGILQQYGLFDLNYGYFCSDLEVHEDALEHPLFNGTPVDFSPTNYVYPLDITDPGFVLLADVRGFPALGYKQLGAGKVVYLGLEYYYDETVTTRILENTLRWLAPVQEKFTPAAPAEENTAWASRPVRRSEETLYAGSGRTNVQAPAFELKIYPNPYLEKATLDLNLEKSAPVSVEMTDETGVVVAIVLPYRVLNSGFYRFELPNVAPGVYFVKCQAGNQTIVRKVVKVSTQ